MMYQIYFSQTLVVNTEGCDSINLAVGRTISDITNICNDLDVMEANLKSVEKRINDCDENDKTTSKLSDAISTDLKRRGMKFIGSTIIYAYLQAVGIINSHDDGCYKHAKKAS